MTGKVNHAIIMAAGRGTRMMPMTEVIPKAMAPFLGSTLIVEGIKRIKPHIQNIHITVGYKGAMLAEHVIKQNVATVFNTDGKGNAWWIYNTLMKHLNEPTFVLTCDNVVELDFEELAEEYYKFNQPACMVVPVKPVPGLEGDYIFHKNHVVTKLDRQEISDCYCSGIQIMNPGRINNLTKKTEKFYNVWDQLIKQKEVYSSRIYPKRWFAVDTIKHLDTLIKESTRKIS
jgi:NDP-sugar pyrophosphorylase family protein